MRIDALGLSFSRGQLFLAASPLLGQIKIESLELLPMQPLGLDQLPKRVLDRNVQYVLQFIYQVAGGCRINQSRRRIQ